MAISSMSDLAAALAGGHLDRFFLSKASIANQLAGGWTSLWRATGLPTQPAIPGAAAIPTKATTGALVNFSTLGSNTGYLAVAHITNNSTQEAAFFCDRLSHMGGLSGTSTSAQTVDCSIHSLKGTRCRSDALDVQWWVEIYTDIGTTGATCTVTYTRDSDGTGGRTTTLTVGGTSPANRAGRIFPIVPANGDVIRSIESVQLSVSTGTAGSFGITATNILAVLSMLGANQPAAGDWTSLGLPTVPEDACLSLLIIPNTTSTGQINCHGKIIKG